MEISSHIHSRGTRLALTVGTEGPQRPLEATARADGRGSAVNGGELLMAALATCYCNDLYREAARLGIVITGCEVRASASFDGVGRGAGRVIYAARIESPAPPADLDILLAEADRLAEIHATLRGGCPVRRVAWEDHP